MDMALGGAYYSKLLLHAILALAARHLHDDDEDNSFARKGEVFLASANELLIHELAASKPRIPTIQALLVLSGRQCAVGKTSEGWLYAGMAFRMLHDLGLHLDLNTSCFLNFVRLGEIVQVLLASQTAFGAEEHVTSRLEALQTRLHQWHAQLSARLKLDQFGDTCPPPHILSLHLLYHTLFIILWRPYLRLAETGRHAREVCNQNADIVHELFIRYGRTFQWTKMTYLVSYCVYTAATVNIEEIKSSSLHDKQNAAKRLAVTLKILESEVKQTPGIRRSVDIIRQQLRSWVPTTDPKASTNSAVSQVSNIGALLNDLSNSNRPQVSDRQSTHHGRDSWTAISHAEQETRAVDGNPGSIVYDNEFDPTFASHDFAEMGWDYQDTGAGFHPTAVPWMLQDPSSSNFL